MKPPPRFEACLDLPLYLTTTAPAAEQNVVAPVTNTETLAFHYEFQLIRSFRRPYVAKVALTHVPYGVSGCPPYLQSYSPLAQFCTQVTR